MRIVLLGCGYVGKLFAEIVSWTGLAEIIAFDGRRESLRRCLSISSVIGGDVRDLSSIDSVRECASRGDLVVEALPSRLTPIVWRACAEVGKDVVSVGYAREDPFALSRDFEAGNAMLLPDAGFAPGLSNVLAGAIVRAFGRVEELQILVGGIPERPVGPIGYVVTWSAEDLLEEYTRLARVLEGGRVVEVDPLERVFEVEIEGVGRLEAFISDGLRTMLTTLRDRVGRAFEATLRWPGHIEAMRLLRSLGLMDEGPVEVDGVRVSPRRVLARILEARLRYRVPDLAVLVVRGRTAGSEMIYRLVHRGTGERSALAYITAAALYAFTALAARELSGAVGVVPPEEIGLDERLFNRFMMELEGLGVRIVGQ